MSFCPCPRTALAAVTFDNGAVLLRCPSHEQQRWVVDGQEVSTPDALALLREAFAAGRDRRPAPGTRRHKIVRMPDAPAPAPAPALAVAPAPAVAPDVDACPSWPGLSSGDTAADLNALLHARGLTGSWAVA